MVEMEMEQRQPFAWCPSCKSTQHCVRNLGTTDWQTTPIYTCQRCGVVIHEPVLRVCVRAIAPIGTYQPTKSAPGRPPSETVVPHTTLLHAADDPSRYEANRAAMIEEG